MNEGDWVCPDEACANVNFSRRVACNRCKKERPDAKAYKKKLGTEIGKSAAEKSRGLFNADDWQCSKCANVNWARRTTCNVCNAPKFGEIEARTGYGGGYNERGVVEYRRRDHSSDEEYDEFGRRKRKRSSTATRDRSLDRQQPEQVDNQQGEGAAAAAGAPAEEGAEDEEESGDEADLAKYDLWGSDSEQPNTSQAGKEKIESEDRDVGEKTSAGGDGDKSQESEQNGRPASPQRDQDVRPKRSKSRSSSSSSSSCSSSSSSRSSDKPRNKYDDFILNSEREGRRSSPECRPAGKSRSRSPRHAVASRRKSRDSKPNDTRDKDRHRERSRERGRSRGARDDRGGRDERPRDDRRDRRYAHYARGRPR